MEAKYVYKKLNETASNGMKINELVKFSYPYRRIRTDITVSKCLDDDLSKVYCVILRAINIGYNTVDKLFAFLGLPKEDDFIKRELYSMRRNNLMTIEGEMLSVTALGVDFVKDTTIIRTEEKEDFQFLIDGISGDFIRDRDYVNNKLDKRLEFEYKLPNRSSEILKDKFLKLSAIYNDGKQALLDYSPDNIKFDSEVYVNYWLAEYIPNRKSEGKLSKIEIYFDNEDLEKEKELTKKINERYREYIYELSETNRKDIDCLKKQMHNQEIESSVESKSDDKNEDFALGVWETKEKFKEALKSVKEKILIESPWIRKATLEYVPYFKEILNKKKKIIIIYGISEDDSNDYKAMRELENLQRLYKKNFILINLPEHLKDKDTKLSGTHRKLVIKDSDYYISASFNFLSFGKDESEMVSNELSNILRTNVDGMWKKVGKEYFIADIIN